jgi:hypothetical protein
MKLIFSSSDIIKVSELKGILECAGIACFIKNELPVRLRGTPELWIEDDSRLDEVLQIKKSWQSPLPAAGAAWTCPKCGEKLEPQFTSCWKCGMARP